MTERTMVTGSPTRTPTPLRGQVIAERYEIRAQLRNDVFSLGMLAFDQESEDRVVLRIVRPELLDATGRAETYRALRKASGTGGRFLPGLLDVDKDGEYVFAVEPIPEGASLRDVLDARIASGEPMTESELLPLVSHLETALAAVPPPLRHGDVRADHVWVDPHRLWLLGAFVVPALPVGAVAALLQKDSGLRRRMAPEVLRGIASDAADRYGVGAIVYEAMTLKTPPEPGEAGELPPTPVGEEVRALIHPDPGLRAKSLDPLVDALAKASGLAVPELDPGTFRAPKRLSVPRAGSVRPMAKRPSSEPPASLPPSATQPDAVLDGDTHQMQAMSDSDAAGILDAKTAPNGPRSKTVDADDGLPPPPVISDEAGTKRFPIDTMKPEKVAETAKLTPLSKKRAKEELEQRMKTAGLDPRLVRAALDRTASAGHQDEEGQDGPPSQEPDSIDPRLVRAALGIQRIDSSEEEIPLDPSVPVQPAKDGTQELAFDELEVADDEDDEVPLDPSVPAKPAKEGTQELRLDDLEVEEMEEEVELDPSVPAQPRKEGTQELRLEDLEMQVGADDEQIAVRAPRAPARDVGLADLEEMRRRREAVPRDGIQPIPRPRKDSLVGMKGPVLFDDSSAPKPQVQIQGPAHPAPQVAAPVAQPAPQVAAPVAQAIPAAPRAPRLDADAAVIVKPPSEPPARRSSRPTDRPIAPRAPRERNWGAIILVVSLVLGAAIIIGSFAFAWYRKQQAEEERRQHFQERIERMRGGTE